MLAAAAAVPSTATADRGIELLSTGGNEAADVQLAMPVANGSGALLQSRGSYWGAEPDGAGSADDLWWSRRSAAGWSFDLATPNALTPRGQATQPLRMTPDGSAVIVASGEQLDPVADTDTVIDLYRYENGTYTLLTRESGEPGTSSAAGIDKSVWVSPDLNRIVFSTTSKLLAADLSTGRDVYQLDNGTLSVLSVDDGGSTTAAGEANLSLGGGNPFAPPTAALVRNMVSSDGSTVFFVTNRKLDPVADTDTAMDVYARKGADTILISDGPAATDPNNAADFAGASADGSKACFVTAERIVPLPPAPAPPAPAPAVPAGADTDNANDLYCRSLADLTTATRVSRGIPGAAGTLDTTGNASTAANGAVNALGLTDDGARMFFISREPLTGDAPAAGTPSIYVNNAGVTQLVSPLVAGDLPAGNPAGTLLGFEPLRPFRMSADGTTAVFTTAAQAKPGVDTDTASDVYRWKSGTPSNTLELLSAGPAAGLPATLSTGFGGALQESPYEIGTPDLSHVLFSTAEQLVPEDTDSSLDVYEYSAEGIKLVSVGGGEGDVRSAGISADGKDVYLHSYAALLPEDDDYGQQDVYVAKTDGGNLPSSAGASGGSGGSAGPLGAGGGGGALPTLPPLPAPTSVTPGTGAAPTHTGSSGSAPFEATLARVKGNAAVRLALEPPSAGRVEVELIARIGGKRIRIGRVTRVVKAGDIPLRVGLSRSARRELRRVGVLKVSARVRFVPDAGSRTTQNLAITLRSPKSKR